MDAPLNVREFEAAAKAVLAPGVYDWYAGGGADEITLRENETAWSRLRLRPRVCVDVSSCDLRTTILGRETAMPIMTAPCSLNVHAHRDKELAVARATAAAGVIQVLSVGASSTYEAVAAAAPGTRWAQMYCLRKRSVTRAAIEQAEAAGYAAICLTVDAPFDGIRERNARNQFSPIFPGIVQEILQPYRDDREPFYHDPVLSWKDLEWMRGITRLPIVLKGILTAEDTKRAIDHGVEGVIVSNHGGRQLDTVLATADALREVVEAAAGKAEIYVDGGVRRGTDVLKALALGARAVLIGRPYLWGLAVDGEAGVRRVLEILRRELEISMALAGCPRIADIKPSLIARATL